MFTIDFSAIRSGKAKYADLNTWPEQPHLDTTVTLGPLLGPMNAIGTHMFAIGHVYMHYEQLKEIVWQAATVNKV